MELTASQLIKLYMQEQIIIGFLSYAPTPEARLLDALNGGPDLSPMKRGKFLELSRVTMRHQNGQEDELQVAYINKSAIHLSATLGDANTGRGVGAQIGPKSYPYVEKLPVSVRLETQSYIVTGNMYHVGQQKIFSVLEDSQMFLPVTHAQVFTIATSIRERLPFVAVNKEHILSLKEENAFSMAGQKAGASINRKSSRQSE